MYMNDEIGLLKSVAAKLESANFDYMITGSMAMALYGMPRMTRDIEVSDTDKLIALFEEDYCLEAEGIRKAIANQRMFNIIHYTQVLKVDFVVRKDNAYRIEEFKRRRQIQVDEQAVFVVALEDLILSKLLWAKDSNSELQYRDVQQLVTMTAPQIDWDYLNTWAHTLEIISLLDKVKDHA